MLKPLIDNVAHRSVEIFFGLRAAAAVFVSGIPIYIGIRYFMYRRKLIPTFHFIISFIGFFSMSAFLAFLQASPDARYVPHWAWRPYIFLTAILGAYAVLELIDIFFVRHYLRYLKRIYISPPVWMVSKAVIFVLLILPILKFTLGFRPLTLVAVPTVLTAAVAFAMQDTLKSIVASIGLGNIMHVGQWITVQTYTGLVEDISWTRKTLLTGDGNRVYP